MRGLTILKTGLLGGAFLLGSACSQGRSNEPVIVPDGYLSVEQIRSDFDALYNGLQTAHADLYAHRDKSDYDALYAKMSAGFVAPLSPFTVQTEFQKFTAYGHVGHARIEFPNTAYSDYREAGGKSFPVYVSFKDGRPFVSENYSGVTEVEPGMEIMAVNDIPMDEFLKSLEQHISADTSYMAQSLLEFTLPQYIWLEYGELEQFKLTLKSVAGKTLNVTIPARPRSDIEKALEVAPAGFALSSHERKSDILEGNIGYLRPGPFYEFETSDDPWINEAFIGFIDGAFQTYLDADVDKLIIDLRLNPGGDNSFSDPMIAWFADEPFRFASEFIVRSSAQAQSSNQARLDANPGAVEGVSGQYAVEYERTPFGQTFKFDIPFAQPRAGKKFEGEVYVLIDRNSYSNAVNTAAIIQDYGMGSILGEKTSDMATTYGAMESFTLPETGLTVGFPKALIIRPNGDRKVDGVIPDISIETPIVKSGEDVVLQKALAIIRGR